jgi:hypothetical protein
MWKMGSVARVASKHASRRNSMRAVCSVQIRSCPLIPSHPIPSYLVWSAVHEESGVIFFDCELWIQLRSIPLHSRNASVPVACRGV